MLPLMQIEEGERRKIYHPDENANEMQIKLERIRRDRGADAKAITGECFRINLPLSKFLLMEELSKEIFIRRYEIIDYEKNDYEEEVTNICLKMITMLDTIAPKGKYFGSHPVHTGVYGYWDMEQNIDSKREKISKIEEGNACISS